MSGRRPHNRARWRLSPWGWILSVALLIFVVLAIFHSSRYVIIGLIAVILVWALLLGSSFPLSRMTGPNRYPGMPRDDLGREAAEEYEREHGY